MGGSQAHRHRRARDRILRAQRERHPIYEVSLPTPDDDDDEAEFIGLVPPGQTIERPAPREWLATYYSPEPVEIEFHDSGGRQWTRNEQGILARTGAGRSTEQ